MTRGDVHLVRLDPTLGSEIQKTRPCVIVSPDELNAHLRTVIVAPMTTAGDRCIKYDDGRCRLAAAGYWKCETDPRTCQHSTLEQLERALDRMGAAPTAGKAARTI